MQSLKRMSRLAAAAAAMLTMAGTASTALAQGYPKTELTFGHFAPSTTGHAQVDQWFANEVAKRSNNQVTIKFFWSGAMGKPTELLGLVSKGAVDVAAVPASYYPAQMPLLAAPSALPMALPSPEKAQQIMYGLWQSVPALQEEAKKANVHPMLFHTLGQYHLLCTSPVRSLADLKGKKIRSQGEYMPKMIAAVGGVPVNVLVGEFYESLQRGSVDCMALPWDLMVAFKLHEVAKHGSTINLGALISNPQWYSLPKWQKLPENVRELLTKVADEAKAVDLAKAKELEAAALETLKKAGVDIVPFADQAKFEAAVPDFLAEWVTAMEKAGKGQEAAAMAKTWRELKK